MELKGKVWKYGPNIDTDIIIAARYLTSIDPDVLAAHCMEDLDPSFAKEVARGDIMVAGDNFGCGSSREHAPIAIIGAGISCVIAPSFARIFYRNAINVGLPILESAEVAADAESGHKLTVDMDTGIVRNETLGKDYQATPYPEFLKDIVQSGGLVKSLQRKFGAAS